jgi:hypothetical protein
MLQEFIDNDNPSDGSVRAPDVALFAKARLEAFEAGKTPYDVRAMCAQLGPSNYIVLGDAVLARDFLTVKAES